MRCRLLLPVLGCFLLSSSTSLIAQRAGGEPETLTVERLLDYETASEPQISPDGTQVVYTRRWVNTMNDEWESALWIVNADGGRHRFLTKGSSPRWSPDGSRLAYLAEGDPTGQQIFVRWMDTEAATTQVTRVDESPGNIRWSPDGTQLGFTMFVPAETTWKIDLPQPPEGAEWTKAPMVADRLHYRQDRRGYTETGYIHLFLVPADSGTPHALTSPNGSIPKAARRKPTRSRSIAPATSSSSARSAAISTAKSTRRARTSTSRSTTPPAPCSGPACSAQPRAPPASPSWSTATTM